MANSATNKFLTTALLGIVFISQISFVFCDLAPNEEEDEELKPVQKTIDDTITTAEPHTISSLGFIHAFIASFSVIIVSEIGDKTFFIAAIMSMVRKQVGDPSSISNQCFRLVFRNIHGLRFSLVRFPHLL